jgi:lipopolysaccharide heptosyltransferase II
MVGQRSDGLGRKWSGLKDLDPQRVLLIKPSSLGDVVHALPVLNALRDRWPRALLAWLVNSGLRSLVEGHQALDRVIPFERGKMRLGWSGLGAVTRLAGELRRERFDLVLDLQGLLRSGLMALATGAPVRVGMAGAREGSRHTATHTIPERSERPHAIERLLDVAAAFGAPTARIRYDLPIRAADRDWANEALGALRGPVLTVNLGARWVTKRWSPEGFAEVARRAVEAHGVGLAMVGAPEDRPLVDQFLEALRGSAPVVDLCGRTTLMQLAAVAERSAVFLSNDTGPLHLAVAAGAYTLGVFTCTRPEWTGAYGPKAANVATQVACAGSCVKQCGHLSCLAELSSERVFMALERQMRRSLASPAAA